MAEGHSSQQPGLYFYQEGGKTFASLPILMIQGIQQSPHFKQMKKDYAAEGIELPKNIMANDPRAHILTPQLQTDSCDTLYVNKDALVAYTITVVQNTQSLQLDQMQIALQTAQNQASIETSLRLEQLMNAHFNLAILTDNLGCNNQVNAQTTETTAVDTGPFTSTADQETYVKTPCRSNSGSKGTKQLQPTSMVPPTCRGDSDFANGIPAGYESDDPWGHNSTTAEPDNIHNHNIVPLNAQAEEGTKTTNKIITLL